MFLSIVKILNLPCRSTAFAATLTAFSVSECKITQRFPKLVHNYEIISDNMHNFRQNDVFHSLRVSSTNCPFSIFPPGGTL